MSKDPEIPAEESDGDAPAKKGGKLGLVLGLVLMLAGGGGGFAAVALGLVKGGADAQEASAEEGAPLAPLGEIAFVAPPAMVVSIGRASEGRHLRFQAQLEVPLARKEDVERLIPRVSDVLNSYLSALSPADLEARAALMRLRAQMLRRVQVALGEGRVNDLLITEFVLN